MRSLTFSNLKLSSHLWIMSWEGKEATSDVIPVIVCTVIDKTKIVSRLFHTLDQ